MPAAAPTSPLLRAALLAAVLLATCAATARAQAPAPASTTSFPYRGTLVLDQQAVDTGGEPGRYDFTFRAFDSAEGDRAIGPVVERPGLPLSQGRFETRLDFGAEVLATGRAWIETSVTRRGTDGQGGELVARSRQPVTFNTGLGASTATDPVASNTGATAPVTSDAEILNRLSAVRVVISDRATPGQAHFLVDEESFRRAFGVGSPVTPTDISAVSLVAAAQLRRELAVSREKERQLETELDRLRFRLNLTLLLLAVLIVSLFVQRRPAATSIEPRLTHATDSVLVRPGDPSTEPDLSEQEKAS